MKWPLALVAALTADIGTITAGKIQDSGGTRYIDLNATGTQSFIQHPGLVAKANGEVTVSAVTITPQTAVSKVLRIPFAEFIPYDGAQSYRFNPGRLTRKPGDAVSNSRFMCPLLLPKGVTITLVSMRGLRAHASDVTRLYLYQNDDSGTATVLAGPLTHTTTTWQTVSSSALSQLVGDQHYTLEVELDDAGSGTSGGTAFAWAEVTYTMSNYAVGI